MSVEIAIAGWFAAPLIARLMNLVIDHHLPRDRVRVKLDKLRQNLDKIRTITELKGRTKVQCSENLSNWLWLFKDAVYAAEDVIDAFEFHSNFIKNSTKFFNLRRQHNGDDFGQLDEVVKKFDSLVLDISNILTVMKERKPQSGKLSSPARRPDDLVPVIGITAEREEIMRALRGSNSVLEPSNFSVVSIVGPGGAGKTLLADLAYNDASIKGLFQIRTWVRVSDNFDIKRLTIKMIESLGIKRPNDLHSIISMGEIRNILTKGLQDLRFLIVLDEVWEESATKWEDLLNPLNCGNQGSRVIVTSQLESIPREVGAQVTINLRGLDENACWKLMKASTFGNKKPNNRQELKAIVRKLACRMGGSALAAIKIGKLLKKELTTIETGKLSKENFVMQRWSRISQLKFGNAAEIAPVLEESYQHLPLHLKQCFLFFALFPENYNFEKDKLIQIWLALGFASSGGQDIGNVVDDLARRSIFKYKERQHDGKYVLHPLLHHVADRIGDGEFFRFEGANEAKMSPKTRYVYVDANNLSKVAKALRGKKNLRGLIVDGKLSFEDSKSEFLSALEKVLRDLKRLRVIVLGELPGKLARTIGGLRHLRYLEVTAGDIKELPKSLSKYYHVERVSRESYWLLRNDIMELIDKHGCIKEDVTPMSSMGSMRGAEEANACDTSCISQSGRSSDPNQLHLTRFWELFLICGVAIIAALILFLLMANFQSTL